MTLITDTIAIGNFIDAEDRATREAAGIRSILCLNGLLQGCKPADCGVEALTCFNFHDGSGNDPWLFDRAVKIVGYYALQHPKLLVHCHAGRSRSVMVVACHLLGRMPGLCVRRSHSSTRNARRSFHQKSWSPCGM